MRAPIAIPRMLQKYGYAPLLILHLFQHNCSMDKSVLGGPIYPKEPDDDTNSRYSIPKFTEKTKYRQIYKKCLYVLGGPIYP